MREHELYKQIATYLQLQYPDVIYRFDLAADLKLTPGQAVKHKKLHPKRGYPDLFLAEPKGPYHGLFIELKREGTRLKKRNGEWTSEHIAEQAEMLERLEFRDYKAYFAIGFDQAINIIKDYLGGKNVRN